MKLWRILISLAILGTALAQNNIEIYDIDAHNELVKIKNDGPGAVQMEGWILCDCYSCHQEDEKVIIEKRDRVYTFRSYLLLANSTLQVKSYIGEDDLLKGIFYWNRRNETDLDNNNLNIWNNDGDIAYLLNSTNGIVDIYSYDHGGNCQNQ